MREGDQWDEVVHSTTLPHPLGGSDRGSHFPEGDTEAPRGCRSDQVPTSAFFREENPISGAQGVEKGHTGDKGLVIASLSLFTLCTGGSGPAVPSSPESPSVPRRALGLSQGQD